MFIGYQFKKHKNCGNKGKFDVINVKYYTFSYNELREFDEKLVEVIIYYPIIHFSTTELKV